MGKLASMLAAAAAAALVLTAVSAARPAAEHYRISATLNAGQEIPKQVVRNQAGHGTFTGTLTGTSLKWKLTFSKLTGSATAAHIHLGAMGKSGNVLVPLCAPCKNGMTGKSKVTAAMIKQFGKHLLYVNVHTAKNPAGEIRGQLGG